MWSYFFGNSAGGGGKGGKSKDLPKKAIVELREHINLLNKKQSHIHTQITNQENEAKSFLVKGNKIQAKNALKKKKIYESQLNKLESTIDSLEQQLFSIESANLNLETMRAMKQGAKAMKSIHNGLDIDKVDETMDEIREQVELGDEISEAISKPLYSGLNSELIDEDELDEELDALAQENVERDTIKSTSRISMPAVPNSKLPEAQKANALQLDAGKNEGEDEEEDEDERALRELQAEMGL